MAHVRCCACEQIDKALVSSTYRWWEEEELRDLCASVGLQGFRRHRSFRFILFTAAKPQLPDAN